MNISSESTRLIEQHRWLVDVTGSLLHPAIPTSKTGLRVADLATGTAVWLLDLAKIVPSDSQLHGFDISSKQYPKPEDRPTNLSLHEQNLLEPFPTEYQGFFDVVAVRLVTAGLRGDDWDTAVRNACSLLS
jgi:hypothetical protein